MSGFTATGVLTTIVGAVVFACRLGSIFLDLRSVRRLTT